MAKIRDWKDYIPASGEAHATIGLKGRFGKGAKMRRFSRRKRGRRVWVADPQSMVPSSPINIAVSAASIVVGISPRLALPTPTATTTPFDQKARLVGIQGNVMIWRDPDGISAADPPVVGETGDTDENSGFVICMYMWKVVQLTADTLSAESAGNNDPSFFASGDLPVLLQTDSVLNWGRVLLNKPKWREPARSIERIWTGDVLADSTYHQLAFRQYLDDWTPRVIPPPRIPKFGITLGRDKALVLYVRPMQWGPTAEDWINLPGADANIWAQPVLRARYEI